MSHHHWHGGPSRWCGRIIHRDNQIELRPASKPSRPGAILVQHHALQGLPFALAAVCPTPLGPFYQARRVQLRLHSGVAPPEAVVAHQVLVEMLHVPAPVRAPVQLQHQPGIRRRNPLRRRRPNAWSREFRSSQRPSCGPGKAVLMRLTLSIPRRARRPSRREAPTSRAMATSDSTASWIMRRALA